VNVSIIEQRFDRCGLASHASRCHSRDRPIREPKSDAKTRTRGDVVPRDWGAGFFPDRPQAKAWFLISWRIWRAVPPRGGAAFRDAADVDGTSGDLAHQSVTLYSVSSGVPPPAIRLHAAGSQTFGWTVEDALVTTVAGRVTVRCRHHAHLPVC
jgi:hypothetical protein